MSSTREVAGHIVCAGRNRHWCSACCLFSYFIYSMAPGSPWGLLPLRVGSSFLCSTSLSGNTFTDRRSFSEVCFHGDSRSSEGGRQPAFEGTADTCPGTHLPTPTAQDGFCSSALDEYKGRAAWPQSSSPAQPLASDETGKLFIFPGSPFTHSFLNP